MSGQGSYQVKSDGLFPGFGLGSGIDLGGSDVSRLSGGTYVLGYASGTVATTTTTTMRWHQPGALRGRGLG